MSRICFVVTAFFLSSPAWAGLYIEPYGGYIEGTASLSTTVAITVAGQTVSENLSDKSNEHGADFGGKLGYSVLGFALGGDVMLGAPSGNGNSFNTTDIGAFVQFSAPMLFKVSATYFVSSQLKGVQVTETDGTTKDSETAKGSGFKAGIGYTGLPFISINLDYIAHNWTTIGTPPGITFSGFSITDSAVMLGISLPLDIGG